MCKDKRRQVRKVLVTGSGDTTAATEGANNGIIGYGTLRWKCGSPAVWGRPKTCPALNFESERVEL